MRRGTTPTLTIEVDDYDLTGWDVYLTFEWHGGELTKREDDLTITATDDGGCKVSCKLTQSETLTWHDNTRVSVQIRATNGTDAIATNIGGFKVETILKDGEI